LLAREQKKDPLNLKGSYAGAMGWGQFMPDSYRDYAVDFDGDNLIDIWNNPTDAIGSVANFLYKKGKWKKDQPVATRAHIKETVDLDGLNKMRAPKKSIAELEKQGFIPAQNYNKDSTAFPMMLTGKYGDEYWLGMYNFYAIGRYNPRIKYAMAVYQLSLMISEQRCEAIENCD
jgi:membrane-bound lytic murein transglycosylase B